MTEVIVSDHALVRYLERALGLNIDSARWAIEHAVREAVACGASSVRSGGLTYMIQGNRVTTIIDAPRRNMAPASIRQEARP
jgi:hypothetical protein